MMHEREKSDPAVVAVKPVNNAERSAAEPVEPRAGAKGNAEQHSTCRAQYRVSVSQALERIRQVRRHSPEVGAVCGKAARTDLCGGRSEMSVPTAISVALIELPSRRAITSPRPPAENGTTMVIGRLGYSCPNAGSVGDSSSNSRIVLTNFMAVSCLPRVPFESSEHWLFMRGRFFLGRG